MKSWPFFPIKQQYLDDKLEVNKLTLEIEEEHAQYQENKKMVYPHLNDLQEVKAFMNPPSCVKELFKILYIEMEESKKGEITWQDVKKMIADPRKFIERQKEHYLKSLSGADFDVTKYQKVDAALN